MRKEQIDETETRQIVSSMQPTLNKAAQDPAYFQFLQNTKNVATIAAESGLMPAWATSLAVDLVGAEVCLMMGGDVLQCVAKAWG